jgi:biotin carboxyl carrier protein
MPAYEVFIDDKPRKIELTRNGQNLFTARFDDKSTKIELSGEKIEAGKGFSIKLDGKSYKVEISTIEWGKTLPLNVEGTAFKAELRTLARKTALTAFEPVVMSPKKLNGVNKQAVEGAVVAPMTGTVVSVMVKQGDPIKAGQTLCVVEAMKMENEIVANSAGVVKEVLVSEGSSVSEGVALFVLA